MQSEFTGHITQGEWRWVLIVSIMLVGLAFLPFLWVGLSNNPDVDWAFMGALHNHVEGASYLSQIRQGMNGNLLTHFLHTPESHPSMIIQPVYSLLGQVSRLASDNLSAVLVFHVARVSVTVFMYLALYQLAATIWMRVRTRRVFFVLVSISSGFGWIFLIAIGGQASTILPIDMLLSQFSPFFSGLASVHVPLAIACIALLSSIIIAALRPGVDSTPNVRNNGVVAFIASIILILLYPEAYILMAIVLFATVLTQWYFARKITEREILWMMWTLIPGLPILIYYVLLIRNNPFFVEWVQQRYGQDVNLIQFIFGCGGVLIIGLPSIWRALRRLESDGDRYMIIWFLVLCVGTILPLPIQSYFLVGAMIPIAFFATRSIEAFWMKRIQRPRRKVIFAIVIPFLMISNLFVLVIPLMPFAFNNPLNSSGIIISSEYRVALEWLDRQSMDTQVVLSSPEVGTWLPLWAGTRAVVGHPHDTMNASEKLAQVKTWYGISTVSECEDRLIQVDGYQRKYSVDFVIYGPIERQLGDGLCLRTLDFIASFGDVKIYQVPMTFSQ